MLKTILILCSLWISVNSVNQCVTSNTDFGSSVIQQLYSDIHAAECELATNVNFTNYVPEMIEAFDFVVIGGGAAGSVVANRLSENNQWKVLLLEAGGDPTVGSEIPGFAFLSMGTELDWAFKTEREENLFLGLNTNTNNWAKGKVLGGSTVLNGMVYLRGNPKDYDNWAALGNAGWGYSSLLPLFKKMEDMRDPEIISSPYFQTYHGKNGPLSIESYDYEDKFGLMNVYKEGMAELGYKYFPDANANDTVGLFKLQGTMRNKRRCSAAKAFLLPAQGRPNLKISKYSHVNKILINNQSAEAIQFTNKLGQIKYVRIKKEVVLSAGTINSPKVLMLSGIGPVGHLNELNIKPVKNLSVGKNLQDHFFLPFVLITHNSTSSAPQSLIKEMFDFLINSSGSLSNLGSAMSYTAFINTSSIDYPEIQLFFFNAGMNESQQFNTVFRMFKIRESTLYEIERINSKSPLGFIFVSLSRPKSRGKVLLTNSNPNVDPKIFSGFLSNGEDLEEMLKGIEFVLNLIKTNAMKSVDAKIVELPVEECKGFPNREYWTCMIRYFGIGGYHASGTCKMGPSTDQDAVVDSRLRVHGVRNIRVADLSITPQIVSTNTQAAAMVIGEKASQLIKEDYL